MDAMEEAARLVRDNWTAGTAMEDLPAALKPATRAEGYAAQAALERLSGRGRAGWKIAATSAAGQRHIGVDGPLAGRILGGAVLPDGATVSLATNRMRVAEPEFAFRFGEAVPPRAEPWTIEEVLARVASLHLAIEVPDSRFLDFARVGGPTLIADDACSREIVLGGAVAADWRALDLSAHAMEGAVAGRYAREGLGANVLGDPRIALLWCANELSALGVGLAPGEFVTTGTCAVPLELEPGDRVRMDFGALGAVSLSVAPEDGA